MATDLSNVDTNPATSPADSDAVSQGASKIRDTRTATMNSFGEADAGTGGTASEHYLAGPHKFPRGDGSFPLGGGVPTPGNAGRLFLDTTNGRFLRDTGAAWQLMRALSPNVEYTAGALASGTSGTFVVMQTVTLNVPTGARAIVLGSLNMSVAPNGGVFRVRLRADASAVLDGSPLVYQIPTGLLPLLLLPVICFGSDKSTPLTTGSHTITLEASADAGSAFTFNQRLLMAIVV